MAVMRYITQPAIDPDRRPSEARRPGRGIVWAIVGLVLLVMGAGTKHLVSFDGGNHVVSQSELVRTVMFKSVSRPATGINNVIQPKAQSAPASTDNGQADCPT
jgi:hypothetical protein